MQLNQELPTSEPTIPERVGPGMAVLKKQSIKLNGIPSLIPVVGETAQVPIAQPSFRCETLKPGEMIVQDRTLMPGKPLFLVGVLTGVLMFARTLTGILILAGILAGILMLAGTPEPEEIDISEGARTVNCRMQIRLSKRHQRWNWIVYRKLREQMAHQEGQDHEVV